MSFDQLQLVTLHGQDWLERQRVAGQVAAACLSLAQDIILNQSQVTLKEIERACVDLMEKNDCQPTFLNYKGTFPGAICASVNKQLVHGIPTDYVLQEGDVIKIDLGATYRGAIGDTAITVIKGQPKNLKHVEMLKACQLSLYKGIEAIKLGQNLGSIGAAISYVHRNTFFGLVTDYGGHGIGENTPHAPPFVFNKAQKTEGVRFQPGMTLAIEPMFTLQPSPRTRILADGWTVVTDSIGCHFEHTIFIHEQGVEILTWRQDETYFKDKLVP